MTSHPPIRVICFDWGGVLLRICRSFAEGCRAAGLPVRPGADDPALKAARKAIADRYQLGRLSTTEFFSELESATARLYTAAEFARIHDAYLLAEYPGVADLVARLNANAAIQTALLSNTNHAHWARQNPSASLPHFPTAGTLKHKVASHHIAHAKPGSEIYLHLQETTGAAPREVLFFDDLAENIATARSLGWHAEQIDHAGDPAAQIQTHLQTLCPQALRP